MQTSFFCVVILLLIEEILETSVSIVLIWLSRQIDGSALILDFPLSDFVYFQLDSCYIFKRLIFLNRIFYQNFKIMGGYLYEACAFPFIRCLLMS